jgi:hypothetical protein
MDPYISFSKSVFVLWNFGYSYLRVKKMKARIAIILVVFAPFLVALTANPGLKYIQNSSRAESVPVSHVSQPSAAGWNEGPLSSLSGSLIGTTDSSFSIVIQEAITTALLLAGSIAVLKKNKNKNK